jgi:hypothetical protein
MTDLDQDALDAAVDLIGRTGAKGFEIGYLHDDVPAAKADWYAQAQYQGARIISENHPGPVEAAEGLARKVLTGAKCTHCHGLIALSDTGATFYPGNHLPDGSVFTEKEARSRKQCRYRRVGPKWVRSCQKASR